jgi:hypothetical protein
LTVPLRGTRARPSILDGTPVPTKGIRELAAEALGRLGIETAPTRMDEANASGKSTQVPTGRVIGMRGSVRRKTSYNGFPLKYERVGPSASLKGPPPQGVNQSASPIDFLSALAYIIRQHGRLLCTQVYGSAFFRFIAG